VRGAGSRQQVGARKKIRVDMGRSMAARRDPPPGWPAAATLLSYRRRRSLVRASCARAERQRKDGADGVRGKWPQGV